MAEAFIGPSARFLLEKLISLVSGKIHLALRFRKDLEALGEYARCIHAFLADAETRKKEGLVQIWFKKVEEVALEAYYVLDEVHYESIRREVRSRGRSKVCAFFSMSKCDVSFWLRMSSKVRDINDKLKIYNDKAVELSLSMMAHPPHPCVDVATNQLAVSRQTDSLPAQFVAGREKEVSQTVEVLLGFSDQNASLLPIVGMGGLGKTTLAKSVYNHPQLAPHFTKKGWVCVSDRLVVIDVLKGILESLKGRKVDPCSRDAIAQQLRSEVNGGRFLFVLDDVWEVDSWNDFSMTLAALGGASGSCCLLTTRLHKTANIVSPHSHNHLVLKKLSEDDCWSILTQMATRGEEFPDGFLDHKNQILRKCQGVPLAAKVIGGLLSFHMKQDWLSIINDLKDSEDVRDEIAPILKLSFDHLPSTSIKKCFAYLSTYAKDARMDGEDLVQFWMAEGFLHEDVESTTTMEEIGKNYLRILLQSSLLEEVSYQTFDVVVRYQMHDLVHDLAEDVIGRKEFGGENTNLHVHHLTNKGNMSYRNVKSPLVQTIEGDISREVLLKFKNLHTLHLSGKNLTNLIRHVSKLKHLRHLTLSSVEFPYPMIQLQPICKLFHLQTLRVNRCDVVGIPIDFSNLINLRHLNLNQSDIYRRNQCQMPYEMRRLTCLQTLDEFHVGAKKGYGIEELGFLKNLKGSLTISNLKLVKGKKEAMSANLFEKKDLLQLGLMWNHLSRDSIDNGDEYVLEGLEPHSNMQSLLIHKYMGVRFPQWLGTLSALASLALVDCKSCTKLPTLGHLPYLKELTLCGLENVVCIGDSFYNSEHFRVEKAFPALKLFRFEEMTNLSEWKEFKAENGDSGEAFSKLETLSIKDNCHLASTPTHFPSLGVFRVMGNVQLSLVEAIIDKSGNLLKNLGFFNVEGLYSLSNVLKRPLTSLEHFDMCNCKDLIDIPSSTFEGYTSLQRLEVLRCSNLKFFPLDFQQTPSLSTIILKQCPNLFTIDVVMFEGCTSLQHLEVDDCSNLKSFPLDFQQTPSLSTIILRQCPNLFTIDAVMPRGFNHLTKLKDLEIGPISDDEMPSFDWLGSHSCSLVSLKLYGSPNCLLPPLLQHCTSLQYLDLWDFEAVTALPDWLGNLSSLKYLYMKNCPKLLHLPSAQAMGNFTELNLTFENCVLFKESWVREHKPLDTWTKLSHLPNIEVRVYCNLFLTFAAIHSKPLFDQIENTLWNGCAKSDTRNLSSSASATISGET